MEMNSGFFSKKKVTMWNFLKKTFNWIINYIRHFSLKRVGFTIYREVILMVREFKRYIFRPYIYPPVRYIMDVFLNIKDALEEWGTKWLKWMWEHLTLKDLAAGFIIFNEKLFQYFIKYPIIFLIRVIIYIIVGTPMIIRHLFWRIYYRLWMLVWFDVPTKKDDMLIKYYLWRMRWEWMALHLWWNGSWVRAMLELPATIVVSIVWVGGMHLFIFDLWDNKWIFGNYDVNNIQMYAIIGFASGFAFIFFCFLGFGAFYNAVFQPFLISIRKNFYEQEYDWKGKWKSFIKYMLEGLSKRTIAFFSVHWTNRFWVWISWLGLMLLMLQYADKFLWYFFELEFKLNNWSVLWCAMIVVPVSASIWAGFWSMVWYAKFNYFNYDKVYNWHQLELLHWQGVYDADQTTNYTNEYAAEQIVKLRKELMVLSAKKKRRLSKPDKKVLS